MRTGLAAVATFLLFAALIAIAVAAFTANTLHGPWILLILAALTIGILVAIAALKNHGAAPDS